MKRAQIAALIAKVKEWRELTVRASTPPWKAAPGEDIGKDWLIASLGESGEDGHQWLVTTDCVHASELTGDAKTDAEYIAATRQAMPVLLKIAEAFLTEKMTDRDLDHE